MSQGDSLCCAADITTIKQADTPISLHAVTLLITLDPVTQIDIM